MGDDQLCRIREKLVQKGQCLPLAVLIQPVGGLIGDQQLCLGAKSKGDGHPLGHAAGQLEGILFQNGFRLCKPHLCQLFAGKGISLRRRNAQLPDAVKQLPANASGWVKKFMPVLRDVHDLPAQHGSEFFSLRQSVSAKGYLTGDQAHISGQHTHDRLRDQRLAGSGLADESQALPGKNMERNPADQLFFRAVQLCGDHAIIILQDRFLQVSLRIDVSL